MSLLKDRLTKLSEENLRPVQDREKNRVLIRSMEIEAEKGETHYMRRGDISDEMLQWFDEQGIRATYIPKYDSHPSGDTPGYKLEWGPDKEPTLTDKYRELYSLAMDFIKESPCDPDITQNQTDAWDELQEAISKYGLHPDD